MSTQQAIAVGVAFLSIAVTVVLFLVGALMRQGAKREESHSQSLNEVKRSTHGLEVTLTRVDATVASLAPRIEHLERWRGQVQIDEVRRLNDTIDQLRRERESA